MEDDEEEEEGLNESPKPTNVFDPYAETQVLPSMEYEQLAGNLQSQEAQWIVKV